MKERIIGLVLLIACLSFIWANEIPSDLSVLDNHGVTIDQSVGKAAPSFKVMGEKYATFPNFEFKSGDVMEFDVYLSSGSLCNLFFGIDSKGKGQLFRLDTRQYRSGFMYCQNFQKWDWEPKVGLPGSVSSNQWHHIRIELNDGSARGFIDDKEVETSPFSFTPNGNLFAVHGDYRGSAGGYFDNIVITSGASSTETSGNSSAITPTQSTSQSIPPPSTKQSSAWANVASESSSNADSANVQTTRPANNLPTTQNSIAYTLSENGDTLFIGINTEREVKDVRWDKDKRRIMVNFK